MAHVDIFESLGPNKVLVLLKPNHFHEISCHATVSSADKFNDMLDPLEMIRGYKNIHHGAIVTPVTPVTPVNAVSVAPHTTARPSDNICQLVYAVLCHMDPTITLFSRQDAHIKVAKFHKTIVQNFDIKSRELGLNKLKITKEDLYTSETALLHYVSRLIKKHFFMSPFLFRVPDLESDDVVIISHQSEYTYEKTGSLRECMKSMCQNVHTKLVKDIRELAQTLMIPLTKEDDTGKKRMLLKNELIESIQTYISGM